MQDAGATCIGILLITGGNAVTILQLKYAIAIDEVHSIRKAASMLYVSQPGLSSAIKELENELGIQLFQRLHNGVVTTSEGDAFISYARLVVEQYENLESKYLDGGNRKKIFSVSMQHHTFAVNAFIEIIKDFGMAEYQYAIRETHTIEVINDIKNMKSEIGVIAVNDFNRQILKKMFDDYGLEFHELFPCSTYVYLHKGHPLSEREQLSLTELEDYPCIVFDQGSTNSFYFREEALATYDFKNVISSNERATAMELIIGLDGFAIGSGLLIENLSTQDIVKVKLKEEEILTLGYLTREGVTLSNAGEALVQKLQSYITE